MSTPETPDVELVAERSGKRWQVAVPVNRAVGFLDLLNPGSATQRDKFIKNVTERFPAIPADVIADAGRKSSATPNSSAGCATTWPRSAWPGIRPRTDRSADDRHGRRKQHGSSNQW